MPYFLIIPMLWENIKKFFPFVGIFLFGYLIIRLNLSEILRQIIKADKFYLLIALVLAIFYLCFQTLKWHILARKQKILIPFKESFKINLMTNFYGLITPGKLGAIMRAEYLKKYSTGGKGLSNFVIDKFMGLISLFFMALLFGFIVLRDKLDWVNITTLIYSLLIFFLISGIFLFFYDERRSRFLLRIVYIKLLPQKMKEKARVAFYSFYEDLPKKSELISVLIFNFISWIICYTVVYFVALSLNIEIKFIYFIAVYPIANLVAQIPITISGLGIREATLIGLFGLFGIEAVKIFSMSLIGLFIMAVFPALIAIPLILKERKKNEIYKIDESRRESGRRFGDNQSNNHQ